MAVSYFTIALLCVPPFLFVRAIYRLLFHPLANVPGPKLAAISKLWLGLQSRKAKNHLLMPELHRRYGRVVRIAPNMVIVCSEDAVKTGYSAGTPFTKGHWYQVCAVPDSKWKGDARFDLLTETNIDRYRMQRRAIGPAYSIRGLEKHEGLVDGYIDKYVTTIAGLQGKKIDLVEWMHIYAFDALSTITIGKSLEYHAQGHEDGNMKASDKHWAYFTTIGHFPFLVDIVQNIPKVGVLLMLPIAFVFRLPLPAGMPFFKFAVPEMLERLKILQSTQKISMPGKRTILGAVKMDRDRPGDSEDSAPPTPDFEEKDLLASLMKLHYDKEARFLPTWVLGIAMTNFGAGHDTSTITLSSCVYHIARDPQVQARLIRELKEQNIGPHTKYSEIVQKLPFLMACIKESMRLFPAIGSIMPRVVPPEGAKLAGTWFPGGTTMAIHLWAIHRDPAVFSDPDEFKPERWMLDGTEEKRKEVGRLDSMWLGFGGGSRSCPGQNLARLLVVKVLVRLFGEFDVRVQGTPGFRGWFSAHMHGVDVVFEKRVEVRT